jgi:hypothetical protein
MYTHIHHVCLTYAEVKLSKVKLLHQALGARHYTRRAAADAEIN